MINCRYNNLHKLYFPGYFPELPVTCTYKQINFQESCQLYDENIKSAVHFLQFSETLMDIKRVASQFFLVSPRDHFVCPVPSFSEMKEIGGRKVLGFQKNW